MSDITLEKTHALLKKLAEYVMNEVATKKELVQKADKNDFIVLKQDVDEIRQDVKENKKKLNIIIDGMDTQIKQLDIIRTEQVATNVALQRHEKRITVLEEKQSGYRIRDAEE